MFRESQFFPKKKFENYSTDNFSEKKIGELFVGEILQKSRISDSPTPTKPGLGLRLDLNRGQEIVVSFGGLKEKEEKADLFAADDDGIGLFLFLEL